MYLIIEHDIRDLRSAGSSKPLLCKAIEENGELICFEGKNKKGDVRVNLNDFLWQIVPITGKKELIKILEGFPDI